MFVCVDLASFVSKVIYSSIYISVSTSAGPVRRLDIQRDV